MGKYKKTLAGFERTDDQPLEANVVFATAAELTTYLQSNPTKYNGQIVIVKGNGTTTKGITYRIDQLGATWKAVPQADGEDVATKAQGGKADTAVQSATVGGVAVPKSGTTLQLPAYPTTLPASDKAAILTAAATDAQTKVNAHAGDAVKHITAAERTKWNTAVQAATVGGVAVPESGTTLQFPAYPTTLPASDKAAILTAAATDAQTKVNAAIKANVTDKTGRASGIATLDGTGKVPASQLPSYVDDVIELKGFDIPSSATGIASNDLMYKTTDQKIYQYGGTSIGWIVQGAPESGKIYLSLQDSKIYRWSGSAMAVVSETLALGETSSTAYPGKKGADNAANITALQSGKLDKTGDGSNLTAAFTAAASRLKIVSGEKLSVTLGKIAKWYEELDNTFLYLGEFTYNTSLLAKLDTLKGSVDSSSSKHYNFRTGSSKLLQDLFIYDNKTSTIQVIQGSMSVEDDGTLGGINFSKHTTIYRVFNQTWSRWYYAEQDTLDNIYETSVELFDRIVYGDVTVAPNEDFYEGKVVWLDQKKTFAYELATNPLTYFSNWKKGRGSAAYLKDGVPFKKLYYNSENKLYMCSGTDLKEVNAKEYVEFSYYASKTAYSASSVFVKSAIPAIGGSMEFSGMTHFRIKYIENANDYNIHLYDECGHDITSVLDRTTVTESGVTYTIYAYSAGLAIGNIRIESKYHNGNVKV